MYPSHLFPSTETRPCPEELWFLHAQDCTADVSGVRLTSFIQSSDDGHPAGSWCLATVNKAAKSRCASLHFMEYLPRSGLAGSPGLHVHSLNSQAHPVPSVATGTCVPTGSA